MSIKEATRVLYGPPHAYERANMVEDILVLDEGYSQYNAIQPFRDLGASMQKVEQSAQQLEIRFAELGEMPSELKSGSFTLVTLNQLRSSEIIGRVFGSVTIGPNGISGFAGEGNVLAITFTFVDWKEIV